MTSFKEIIQSIFDSSRERIKNPIVGAFIFSWLALNWRIVLIILFSNKKIVDKIALVEEKYIDINLNFWYPLAFAAFYVLILPYVMALFDWLSQKGISSRRLIAKNHRLSEIQGRQEIAAEEWQLEKIRQGSPDISGLKEKVVELEALIQEKDDVIQKLAEQIDSQSEEEANVETAEEEEEKEERPTKTRPIKKTNKASSNQTKKVDTKTETPKSTQDSTAFPVMKDIVIRDLAKTEREWILIYALYSSDYGKKTLTREDLINRYSESNRRTDSRIANLSNNLKTLIKSGQLKYINDDEMLLTSQGQEIAKEILNR